MEEDLISKKDLLELTGISYGQLYRWKRKGLIPDEWFIRKSTFTGQETFFPRSKVLSRIYRIKDMKEDVSLDDLAEVFSPAPDDVTIQPEDLVQRDIVSKEGLSAFLDQCDHSGTLGFEQILSAYATDRIIRSGDVALPEAQIVLQVMRQAQAEFKSQPYDLFLMRKMGVFTCFAASLPCNIALDESARLIMKLNMTALIEELKLKLM